MSAVREIIDDIHDNGFILSKTRSGSQVIIFTRAGGGPRPLLGAYFNGDEWIPAAWTELGAYVNDSSACALDLMQPDELNDAA